MPAFLKIMVMAVVQGLTEFLPVSSSGHLVLAKSFLGLDSPGALLEVALHAGTLCSILVYYRRRILTLCRQVLAWEVAGRRYALAIMLGSVPAILAFLLVGESIEALFEEPVITSAMLCVTAVLLLTLMKTPDVRGDISVLRGGLIGLAQAFAIIPGVSRSGSTIVAGRYLGLSAERAAEFSFLLSVPAIAGATLVKAVSLGSEGFGDLTVLSMVVGILVSAVTGYAAIAVIVRILTSRKFWVFGIYCLVVGAATLIWQL